MGTLRFLLALCVVVTHAGDSKLFGISLLSGITAVQGFYIVSGFLITLVLNTRAEYQSISRFYISRYLRLWPAYAVVAVLSLATFKSGFWQGVSKLDLPAALFVIVSNCTIFFQDLFLFFAISPEGSLYPTTHFATEPGTKLYTLFLIPQAWSLGIELTFYLIAPFICRSPTKLLALFSFGILTRIAIGLWSPTNLDPWLYRFSPAEMMLFATGGLGYFAGTWLQRALPQTVLRAAGLICMAVLVFVIVVAHEHMTTLWETLFLSNGTILAIITVSCPFLLVASRGWTWDGMLGELSYPMYLSHIFINEMIARYAPQFMAPNNFDYVCATIIFSTALLWLVVLPIDRFRRKFGARAPTDYTVYTPLVGSCMELPVTKSGVPLAVRPEIEASVPPVQVHASMIT
jgi:peptidoglycan/LPS O-acetylase OafA/YrhL